MRTSSEIQCCGIVLYKEDYLEADLRVVAITDRFGVLSFYIKGVRKTKKRDMAALDVLSYSNFSLVLKNNQYQIKEFELIEDFDNIKKDLFKISSALYIADVIKRIVPEGEKKEQEFNLLLKSFFYFNRESNQEKILLAVAYFIFRIISMEGICFEKADDVIFTKKEEKKEERMIIEAFLTKKVKFLLEDKLERGSIFNSIEVLERYINEQLEIRLNFKKMIII